MTNDQKKMKRYMTAIERRLNLPRDAKVRVMTDLQSSVAARREAGQSDEEIFSDLGAALAGALLAAVMLVFEGITGLMVWLLNVSVNESNSLGIIGGADGPTAIFVTTAPGGYDWVLWVLLLVMCGIGWWKLSHCSSGDTGAA